MKGWIAILCTVLFLVGLQPQVASAEDAGQTSSSTAKNGKSKRCHFTRKEKFGMFLWLIPLAGAIYTPFACNRNLFAPKDNYDKPTK